MVPQLLEYLAEFLKPFLVPPRVELEWTLHNTTVVQVGNVDDVDVSGVMWLSFLLVLLTQLIEKCTNDSHGLTLT